MEEEGGGNPYVALACKSELSQNGQISFKPKILPFSPLYSLYLLLFSLLQFFICMDCCFDGSFLGILAFQDLQFGCRSLGLNGPVSKLPTTSKMAEWGVPPAVA